MLAIFLPYNDYPYSAFPSFCLIIFSQISMLLINFYKNLAGHQVLNGFQCVDDLLSVLIQDNP